MVQKSKKLRQVILYFDADPDLTFHFYADPDLTFHSDQILITHQILITLILITHQSDQCLQPLA